MTFTQYMINDMVVSAPDSETWLDNDLGVSLDHTRRISPYRVLVWRIDVANHKRLDWFAYSNIRLVSLTTRSPDSLKEWIRYTDVVCQQVTAAFNRNQARQVEAHFLVNTEI